MTSPRRPRLVRVLVAATAIAVAAATAADALQVTREDLAEAEAAERAAEAELRSAREELATAVELRDRLSATIESLTSQRAEVGGEAAEESLAVRDRVARMYMVAGNSDELLAAIGDVGGFFLRLSYLSAVADRDLETVNRFVLVIEDLEALRDQAERHLEDLAAEVAALELLTVSRSAALEDASERLGDLRDEWAAQEAARKAALEAELRRQEEELARQAAAATTTTTTTQAPGDSTTTTTAPGGFPIDDGGYVYDPTGGVEQWRPLLSEAFARWGLDQEKCGPEGCLGPHIDDALTIMWCESRGVPFAVNPSSGTTGLFQHRPIFWQDRVERTRSKPWAVLPVDATPYNAAHNIEVAALLIWESRETLIGSLGFGRPWSDGPEPFGHWDSTSRYCADPPLVWP